MFIVYYGYTEVVRGKNIKNEGLRKEKRITEENYMKNGRKALKIRFLGLYNQKKLRGASPRPPKTYSSGEKNLKRGGRGMIEIHNIYPCKYLPAPAKLICKDL